MRIVICLLVSLLLSGCLGSETDIKAAVQKGCRSDSCSGLTVKELDECLLKQASDCKEMEICGKIMNRELEYRCRLRFGDYDPILCGGILNESVKVECYINGAELGKDTRLCEKIVDQASEDMCRANVAYKTANRTLCAPIRQMDRRDFCFAVADGDGTICGNLVNSDLRVQCVQWTMKKLPKM
jgi:hypothetical protein